MIRARNRKTTVLPYINRLSGISITAILSVVSIFIFKMNREMEFAQIIVDAAIFGFVTVWINVFVAWYQMRKRYREGRLPREAPASRLVRKLPANPVLLALTLGIVFAAVVPAGVALIMLFYEKQSLGFYGFFAARTIYAVLFSAYIMRVVVFRYVQPGAFAQNIPQHGEDEVKILLPKISTLREKYQTMLLDFGFNLLIGLFFNGVFIDGKYVVVAPVYRSGILISAIVFSIIVTIQMAVPIASNILSLRESGELAVDESRSGLSWLPRSPMGFGCICFLPIAALSIALLWGMMTLFELEELNFFQYYGLRVVTIMLLNGLMLKLAVFRYSRPFKKSKGV